MNGGEGIGLRAALPALAGASLLAGGTFLVDRQVWRAAVLGAGLGLMLFVALGFPRLAQRPVLGRVRIESESEQVSRVIRHWIVLGSASLLFGVLFDSVILIVLAICFWLFWFGLLTMRRREGSRR
jgi:hypothetical protein